MSVEKQEEQPQYAPERSENDLFAKVGHLNPVEFRDSDHPAHRRSPSSPVSSPVLVGVVQFARLMHPVGVKLEPKYRPRNDSLADHGAHLSVGQAPVS